METFFSYFVFDNVCFTVLALLFVVVLAQGFFYLWYYNKPMLAYKKGKGETSSETPSVSVIIVAKDECDNLNKNLPIILTQDYPDYEVIVVNDGSADDSEFVLKRLKEEYPHLYTTFAPASYENESRRQRILSLTIGIKAANKDVFLFTEADATPSGKDWIRSMVSALPPGKDIAIGYCRYRAPNGFWAKIALLDNLLFSLQYLSMAIRKKPFTGIYRNIAYRKKMFFDNKGFSSVLKYDNAEEVFLNQIMKDDNTAVALGESSFVYSSLENYFEWKFIKVNYMRAKRRFSNLSFRVFYLETLTRYLLYALFVAIVVCACAKGLWLYILAAVLLVAARFAIQSFILRKAAQHFHTDYQLSFLLVFDVLQTYYNNYFKRYSRKKFRPGKM
jgi:glycosyltransferase involved in cell wall biosynthesis